MTVESQRNHSTTEQEAVPDASVALGRRRFLTYLVAAPLLTVATRLGIDTTAPANAHAVVPSGPSVEELFDIAEAVVVTSAPTMHLVKLVVNDNGDAELEIPRAELGQGLTTSLAMLVAEELDLPLDRVHTTLADGRPELLFNQLTAGSSSIRAFYEPLRVLAATAKARMLAAAAQRWGLKREDLRTREGSVVSPDGRETSYGTLSAAAAKLELPDLTVTPKPESEHTLIGKPTRRSDAVDIVTGRRKYAMDLEVPGAKPTMVRRAPTINGEVDAVHNQTAVEKMPGVLGVVVIHTGVAVMAETFEQARQGVNALDVTFTPGPVPDESNASIQEKLRAATLPLAVPPVGSLSIEAEFEWHSASHAPLEPETAVADVRPDSVEMWSGFQTPIWAQQLVAKELSLPQNKVTAHVVHAGGGFGRRCFPDGALEAVWVSQALGRPSKVMWHRTDDMRHGRVRPANFQRIRATIAADQVLTFEQRVTGVSTDFRHGLGEALTAAVDQFPEPVVQHAIGNDALEEAAFLTMVSSPYNFGVYDKQMIPVPIDMRTASYRAVPCPTARGCEEIMVDEIAEKMGKDPVEFRHEFLKDERARAVLAKTAEAARWGKEMPPGFAQGVGYHSESRALTACVVELDGRDPHDPRVTKATMVIDVGRPINPLGLEAQMQGCLAEAVSLTLRAGLHIENGLPLEGSYSQYHYARQRDYPSEVEVIVMPANGGQLGGAGEVGIGAPTGAIANAFRAATGIVPRSFPLVHPVDFEPIPPGELPEPAFPKED